MERIVLARSARARQNRPKTGSSRRSRRERNASRSPFAPPVVAPGLRVRHPVFGPGSILAVSGDGAGQKLRIRFDRAGVKTVLVRYAKLELG